MDLSLGTILTGFVASTIGFSLFLYGKKQARLPQLLAGIGLMLAPFVAPGPWWCAAVATGIVGGLVIALRCES